MKFLSQGFQKSDPDYDRQTDTHTDSTEHIIRPNLLMLMMQSNYGINFGEDML